MLRLPAAAWDPSNALRTSALQVLLAPAFPAAVLDGLGCFATEALTAALCWVCTCTLCELELRPTACKRHTGL